MNTKQPMYLFFDYDNTVRVNGRISEQTVAAMTQAHNLGHRLILCTGRARGSTIEELDMIPWDGMIYGGADIIYHQSVLETCTADVTDILIWTDFCIQKRLTLILEGQKQIVRYPFDESTIAIDSASVKNEILEGAKNNPITKLSILGNGFQKEHLPVTEMNPIIHPEYIEVFGKGRDKGVAIRRFCELLSTSLEQCACFGDSMNDYAMFLVCPVGISMKWAPQPLIDVSSYHSQGDEGVAEGLAWLLAQACK